VCARFISEDPIGWASGQTNNYAYVGVDPVSWIDPTGRDRWGPGPSTCELIYYPEPGVLQGWKDGQMVDAWAARTSNPKRPKPWTQSAGPIPPGSYTTGPMRQKTPQSQEGAFCDQTGSCWSVPLQPNFVLPPGRSDFAIHPDGGRYGTAGCIGCSLSNSSSLRDFLRSNLGCGVTAY
jgi:hypothetical protein